MRRLLRALMANMHCRNIYCGHADYDHCGAEDECLIWDCPCKKFLR